MTRSLHEPDLSSLERELREALRGRAATTPIAVRKEAPPTGPAAGAARAVGPVGPVGARRRPVVAIAAVAAAVVLVVLAITQLAPTTEKVRTAPADQVPTTVGGPAPDASSGLSETDVPRLVIEGAPVVTWTGDGTNRFAGDGTTLLQAFWPPGRLDGPMIFLTTVSDLSSFGLVDDARGEPVEVRGRIGYIADPSSRLATTLSVDLGDGTAIYVYALGLTDLELIGFLDDLEQSEPGGRWTSTADLRGMTEVPIAPDPAVGHHYGAHFDLPDPPTGPAFVPGNEYGEEGPIVTVPGERGTTIGVRPPQEYVEVHLYEDGFENRLSDLMSSTDRPLEMVEVAGRPAVVGAYGELDWFVLIETESDRALEVRVGNNRATVDWVIEHAGFVDQATWDAATGGR